MTPAITVCRQQIAATRLPSATATVIALKAITLHVKSHNGRGLFYSVHLNNPAIGDEIVMGCIRRGVLMFLTGRGFFKIVPPLTIDRDALFEAIGVIGEVMDERLK